MEETGRERIVIPGGSGFLGQSLAAYLLARGYEVVVLSRSPRRTAPHYREVAWDGASVGAWQREVEGARAVVNMTGKSVNCRYTPANQREILASRIHSVNAIGAAIQGAALPPPILIQAASLAIYGNRRAWCDESAPPGEGFSVFVCRVWEATLADVLGKEMPQAGRATAI